MPFIKWATIEETPDGPKSHLYFVNVDQIVDAHFDERRTILTINTVAGSGNRALHTITGDHAKAAVAVLQQLS